MAIYELTLLQEFKGVRTVNRWNYVLTGVPAAVTGSFALTQAFGYMNTTTLKPLTVLGFIQSCQHSDVKFLNLVVKNLYSSTDFYETPFIAGTAGTITGVEASPPFVSFGFRTNRVRTDVARGTKRFIGLIETWVNAGELTAPGLTAMNTLAGEMNEALTYSDEGNTLTFSPAVCGKEEYTTPKGTRAYRYHATEEAQMAKTALGVVWQPYATARSQTSRQYGRGI